MSINLKKAFPILLLFISVFIFADEKPPSIKPVPIEKDHLPFFIGASYTFWKPYQSGINIAYSEGNIQTKGTVIEPKTHAVSGFKVAAGTHTFHEAWDVCINYTWFNQTPSTSNNPLKDKQTIVYQSPFFDPPVTNYASLTSKFNIQFNRIDGFVKKDVLITDFLTLSPWMGLLGAWDKQRIQFDGKIDILNDTQSANMRQIWWGIGPYSGALLNFYCFKDISIFIRSGTSLLYTQHYVKTYNFINNPDGSKKAAVSNNLTDFYSVDPMLETSLGINWKYNQKNYGLRFLLAWELQTYFNHNGFQDYASPIGNTESFSMQGLTIGAQFDF